MTSNAPLYFFLIDVSIYAVRSGMINEVGTSLLIQCVACPAYQGLQLEFLRFFHEKKQINKFYCWKM
jgi:hypothetical protein